MPISRLLIEEEKRKAKARVFANRAAIIFYLYNHPFAYFTAWEINSLVLPKETIMGVIETLVHLECQHLLVEQETLDRRCYYAISPLLLPHKWSDGVKPHIYWLLGRFFTSIYRIQIGNYDGSL